MKFKDLFQERAQTEPSDYIRVTNLEVLSFLCDFDFKVLGPINGTEEGFGDDGASECMRGKWVEAKKDETAPEVKQLLALLQKKQPGTLFNLLWKRKAIAQFDLLPLFQCKLRQILTILEAHSVESENLKSLLSLVNALADRFPKGSGYPLMKENGGKASETKEKPSSPASSSPEDYDELLKILYRDTPLPPYFSRLFEERSAVTIRPVLPRSYAITYLELLDALLEGVVNEETIPQDDEDKNHMVRTLVQMVMARQPLWPEEVLEHPFIKIVGRMSERLGLPSEFVSTVTQATKSFLILGMANVLNVAHQPNSGLFADCSVRSGMIGVHYNIRVIRNGTIVYKGKIRSLQQDGKECSSISSLNGRGWILLDNFNYIHVGDILESYTEN